MDRFPVVSGQFYPGQADVLAREVDGYLALAPKKAAERTLLAMAPHAGYVFSGGVAGQTLGQADLAPCLLLLGPNHTGLGDGLAVWPFGSWLSPLGAVAVDVPLAQALLGADARLSVSTEAHAREHSLEVLLPFVQRLGAAHRIVPVAVAEPDYETLEAVARSVAGVLAAWPEPVSLVVSSDMSHFVSHATAKRQDSLALEAVLRLDPAGLYDIVRARGITMCGVLPMTLGLMVAKSLGATQARLAAYATSGEASGDYGRVVGYAGVLVS